MFDKTTNILASLVRLCPEIPTIAAIPEDHDGTFSAVLIGKGNHVPKTNSLPPKVSSIALSENTVLAAVLRNDPILPRLFRDVVALKDSLRILPLIKSRILSILQVDITSAVSTPGEIIVTFHGLTSPKGFVINALIPFLSVTNSLQGAMPSLRRIGGVPFSVRCDLHLSAGTIIPHPRAITVNILQALGTKALHSMEISIGNPGGMADGHPISDNGSEETIRILAAGEGEDKLAYSVLVFFLEQAGQLFPGDPKGLLRALRRTINDALPRSVPAILSRGTTDDRTEGIAESLLLQEYQRMAPDNLAATADVLETFAKEKKGVFGEVNRFITSVGEEDRTTRLSLFYRDLFAASLLHPYLDAFLPYCLNEVLAPFVNT